MSILIKGMEMPKAGQVIEIAQAVSAMQNVDGKIFARLEPSFDSWHEIVIVPTPHGPLKDAEWVREKIDTDRPGRMYEDAWALTVVDNAPTIIEAEEGVAKEACWFWGADVRCSSCGYKLQTTGLPQYCPNCGARMKG